MYHIQTDLVRHWPGVVIAGAGVAGCAAALGAARAGAKVLLLEEGGAPGGMAGGGLISQWMPGTLSPLRTEIDRRIAAHPLAPPAPGSGIGNECLQTVLLELLAESGTELLLHSRVIDAECEGNRLASFCVENSSGIERITAPLFIDATGDGTPAARAGAAFSVGREVDRLCQGASLMFHIGGVDHALRGLPESFNVSHPVPAGDLRELALEHLTPPAGHVILHRTAEPGVICANMTNAVGFNFLDAAERTKAELLCRKQIGEIIPFLRRFLPGFERSYLAGTASQFGVRESRHFHGDYRLTSADIRAGRIFPDWIAAHNYFPFDIHNVKGMGLDEAGELEGFTAQGTYTVPLGACLPAGMEGLLLAGRNISGSHKAHSSFRVMPVCLNIGQGAGVAAALALREKVSPRKTPVALIQQELIRQGVKKVESRLETMYVNQ